MFYIVLFYFMPKPENMIFLGYVFEIKYALFYKSIKNVVISYHRKELYELDYDFRMRQAGEELVRRREIAIEQGIDPLDKKYPDIFDILKLDKRN